MNSSALLKKIRVLQKKGAKIVFTNGCFDILHVGHVRYLRRARALGDALVIGLNTDASVRALKGPERPINTQEARAEVLLALKCVDFVIPFAEKNPEKLIRKVRPAYLVKGGDWKKNDIVGSEFVESYGGKVRSLPFVDGYSTTRTIQKVRCDGPTANPSNS